jgi:NADPH-dependent 2,4-dienoyl-CoA reductase/sulfur reductase-like enzyme
VFPTVHEEFGHLIEEELKARGVQVITGVEVEGIESNEDCLVVCGSSGFRTTAHLVLYAVGVQPNSELARSAGIKLGERGASSVDREMRTDSPAVFAAGGCVQTWHRILQRNTYMPLGTTAHKQGRVAGENMPGRTRAFEGAVGTQVIKIFGLIAARTGLKETEAREAGFEPVTVESEVWDHFDWWATAQRASSWVRRFWEVRRARSRSVSTFSKPHSFVA